jgi:3D (Asp-Asp-Asp) domain-containing protein
MIDSLLSVAASALLSSASLVAPVQTEAQKIVENVKTEIVSTETKKLPVSANKVKRRTITVTAYSSTPDQTDDSPFITANGTVVRDGVVATNFLPFGTRVRFPEIYGDKEFIVADRMNTRYFYRIDIWMPDRKDALKFGKKDVLVEILPPASSLAVTR